MNKQGIKKALILSFTTLLMTQCGDGNEDVINVTDSSNWANTKRTSEIEYNTQMTDDEKNAAAMELFEEITGFDFENPFGLPNIDYNE